MLDRGKLAVLAMLAVAAAAAAFAWWFNYRRGHRCLEFYGSQAALLIRTSPRVELLQLVPVEQSATPGPDGLEIDGRALHIANRLDISQANGLIHARASLLDDTSYMWDAATDNCDTRPRYAVRFSDQNSTTIALDLDCQRAWQVEQHHSAKLIPKVAEGWKSFLSRHAP